MVFSSRYEIEIPSLDLLSYVFDTSASNPHKPLYVKADNDQINISKTGLESLVQRLAGGLRKVQNVDNDDVVLLFAGNSIWYPVIVLGVICAGGIFTGANPGYTAAELQHQIDVSGAKCIFTDRARLPTALLAAKASGIPQTSVYVVEEEHQAGEDDGVERMESLLTHGPYAWERITDVDSLSQRTAVLNFSSGTTGLPKAGMITHRNLVANSEQTLHLDRLAAARQSDADFASRDVHCAYVPLYHAMGLLTFCVVNVRRCCTTIVMHKFDLKALLSYIQQFRITYLLMVPPVALMLCKSPLLSSYDISSVKYLLCGAAPLGPETSARLEDIFKAKSRQGWGMTETTMAVTLFAPDEYDPSHQSVGYLVPNMQMKIINSNGQEVGYDEEGEALVRGPNVFKGYYRNPAATAETWSDDGWLKTGDIIIIRPTGLISILDRQKEFIKVKGFQVAPSELESHLLQHEGVQDCAVIRVERNGEEHPQAHVVRRSDHVTAESIINFIEGRLSAHKRITGGIVFTDTIPKSPSGKILRRMLKDPYKDSAPLSRL